MDGQQQNFYLDNLNFDSNEINWDRGDRNPTPPVQNVDSAHDPRTMGSRVSAFPDSAFNTPSSAESAPSGEKIQPKIITSASLAPPEPLNPALITPPIASSESTNPISSATSTPEAVATPHESTSPHESAITYASTAESKLTASGDIAGFYDEIRNYGEIK